MNSACQAKKHSNKSASRKSHHILREDLVNPNIVVFVNKQNDFQNNDNFPCKEKHQIKKITEIKNKINVYTKRLDEYINRGDVPEKRILKIEKQIKDLQKDLTKLNQNPPRETRGKKRKLNYFELELSLTKSNKHKNDESFQNAVHTAIQRTFESPFLEAIKKNMELKTEVMHLDQYSIHEHLLFKVNDNATIDQTLKELVKDTTNDGRDGLGLINDIFHEKMEEELQKLGFELEEQESGKEYLSLKDFKALNPLEIEEEEEIIEKEFEELTEAPRPTLQSRLDAIEEENYSKFSKGLKSLSKFVENMEAETGIPEAIASNLEEKKEEETEEKAIKKRGRKAR